MLGIFKRKTLVPVYHLTSPANAKDILKEGLMRNHRADKPSQAVEFLNKLFSAAGEEFEVADGRKQTFAWPTRNKIERDIRYLREKWGEHAVLEVMVDPANVKVTHQDCFTAAYQLVFPAIRQLYLRAIEEDKKEGCPRPGFNISNTSGGMLWYMREAWVKERHPQGAEYEEFHATIDGLMPQLELLARTYWEIAVPLTVFDNAARAIYLAMMEKLSKAPALRTMIEACGDWTNAEAIIFAEKISRRKIRILDI